MKPTSWIKQYFHPCMGEESLVIQIKQFMSWTSLPFCYWHKVYLLAHQKHANAALRDLFIIQYYFDKLLSIW
uniref:Uncharacterized protein n=1 Tax=Arundo donax TaxID=35708 RepID=A0A0A9E3A9_ARUDO